jgi:glycosyltransferase involved in cell wall biosynthesis
MNNNKEDTFTSGLVSIITPLYNSEKYISGTIESVISQTYSNWEMIIINDGSTDKSVSIVEKYLNDKRIFLIQQKNQGTAVARNNGIRNAHGQYIALLDSDDLWESVFLESQLNLMKKSGGLLVYASHKRIDENNCECLKPFRVKGKIGYNDLLKTCSITCVTGLYDTSSFGKIYLREELKSIRDDYMYWLDIIKKVKTAYANPEIIASYRIFHNSITKNKRSVIKPQFRVYFEIEKLGILKSLYYLCTWAFYGFIKYKK